VLVFVSIGRAGTDEIDPRNRESAEGVEEAKTVENEIGDG